MSKEIKGYNDRNHEGNSKKYHTGKKCVEKGCNNPAGTWWSPLWCVDCNIKRIDNITHSLEKISKSFN